MAKKRKKRNLYRTTQIAIERGMQLRITHGRRTIFVYCNGRGLNICDGGYARARSSTG